MLTSLPNYFLRQATPWMKESGCERANIELSCYTTGYQRKFSSASKRFMNAPSVDETTVINIVERDIPSIADNNIIVGLHEFHFRDIKLPLHHC
jgi:hypothetical protein